MYGCMYGLLGGKSENIKASFRIYNDLVIATLR